MFDWKICFLTVGTVAFLQIFILTGYFLRRSNLLGHDACRTVSLITSHLFIPAYTLSKLPQSFTPENLGTNAKLLGFSTLVIVAAILLARGAAHILGRSNLEKKTFSYFFAFSNTGYFGLPVIEGVFGEAVLGQFIVFTLPISIAGYSYGWGLFVPGQKLDLKKCLFSPSMIATYISAFLGLTGLYQFIPAFLSRALAGTGACMSPCAMILAGLVMGARPLKALLFKARPWFIECIRILAVPLLIGLPLYFLGVRGVYLFMAFVVVGLPAGMNIIVFPESMGHDATENSGIVFVSTLLSILTVPTVFSVAKLLSGLTV